MNTDVRIFRATDPNAPTVNNVAGKFLDVLDACLVTGYGSVTLSSLSYADGIATATVDAGHGYSSHTVVEIAGANEAVYNGEHRITVTSATQFTFPLSSTPSATPATGTITAKIAPMGWEKLYSGTNKAVYRPTDQFSLRPYLRVENAGSVAYVRGYTTMTDVDTGDNPFPTVAQASGAGLMWHVAPSSTNSDWVIIGDSAGFWFWTSNSGQHNMIVYAGFGDLIDIQQPGDLFASFIGGNSGGSTTTLGKNLPALYLSGSYLQTAGSRQASFLHGSPSNNTTVYAGNLPFPDPIENSAKLSACWVRDSDGIRGRLPGIHDHLHTNAGSWSEILSMAGKTFFTRNMAWPVAGRAVMALDDWR